MTEGPLPVNDAFRRAFGVSGNQARGRTSTTKHPIKMVGWSLGDIPRHKTIGISGFCGLVCHASFITTFYTSAIPGMLPICFWALRFRVAGAVGGAQLPAAALPPVERICLSHGG